MTKYTIKPGQIFEPSIGRTDFFNWLQLSGIDVSKIDGTADIVIETKTGATPTITAKTTTGAVGTWPLNPLWSTVTEWLDAELGPKVVSLDGIATRLYALREARAKAAEYKAQAEELRAEIMGALAAAKGQIGTVDGEPVIQDKVIPKTRFERKAFEAAYPDLAQQYITEYDEHRLEFIK